MRISFRKARNTMGIYDFVSTENSSEETGDREMDALKTLEKVYGKGEISLEEYEHLKNAILGEHNEENIESTKKPSQVEADKPVPVSRPSGLSTPLTIATVLIVVVAIGFLIGHYTSGSNSNSASTNNPQTTSITTSRSIQTSFADIDADPTSYLGKQITINGTLNRYFLTGAFN